MAADFVRDVEKPDFNILLLKRVQEKLAVTSYAICNPAYLMDKELPPV